MFCECICYSSIRAVDKPKSTLGALIDVALETTCNNLDERRATRRNCPCDSEAFICDNTISKSLCEALVEQSEKMGYSFWNPEGGKADFRSADTVEVRASPKLPFNSSLGLIKFVHTRHVAVSRHYNAVHLGEH